MAYDLKQKVFRGVCWRLAERFGSQGMGFVVGVVLARLLGPDAYGTIALLTIFLTIANLFVDGGFGTALVQKKDATELDFNSVFYLSVTVSLALYIGLFCASPVIAQFYRRPILIPVLRVLAIIIIINAVNGVQNAVLARKMLFNLSFRISLVGTFVNGVVGISLAYLGLGVWALVYSSLGSAFATTVLRWYLIGWRPGWKFSLAALRPLFNFSWKMLASGFLDTFFGQLYGLIIGRVYTPADLAFYNKGRSLPQMAMDSINGTLGSVSFPALSQLQDDRARLKEAMRQMILVSTFFVMPALALMAAGAEPFTLLVYGEQWRGSIVFVQIACISFSFYPFHTINLQGIQALGRSDIFLKLEVVKKLLCLVSICIVYKFGVVTFALVGALVMTPLGVCINAWPNRRLMDYGLREQIRDVLPTMAIAAVVFCTCRLVLELFAATTCCLQVGMLFAQGVAAMAVIAVLAVVFRPRALLVLAGYFPSFSRLFGNYFDRRSR